MDETMPGYPDPRLGDDRRASGEVPPRVQIYDRPSHAATRRAGPPIAAIVIALLVALVVAFVILQLVLR